LQRTVKKAIVDRLSRVWNTSVLPETGSQYTVEISLLKDRATLTLDSTGRGLHRRGYRLLNAPAPLRETLASALVQLSTWRPERPLIDPFCGSGTIPIEAAMLARNIAPGLKRSFDAEAWPCIPRDLWNRAREEAQDAILPPLKEKIYASDVDSDVLKLARKHAIAAGVDEDVVFSQKDFRALTDSREYGCVVCNPPYGERIGELGALRPLYESIPAVFSKLPTWSFFVITDWLDFEKVVGREATRRRKLYNSRIECVYYQFLGPKPPYLSRRDLNDETTTTAQDSSATPSSEVFSTGSELEQSATSAPEPITPVFAGLDEYAAHQETEFGRCLANRVRHLRRFPSRGITCYRLYDRDFPEVPLAIDIFEGRWLHIAEYERPDGRTPGQHRLWLDKMVAKAAEITQIEPENVFLKRRARQRGKTQYEKLDESGRIVRVREGGLTFLCNMTDYLDVGLFLDHRQTREMARREAKDRRFLNLFCYSGAFTCFALDGGASSTVSVDLSPTYLDWAAANLEENGFRASGENRFVKSDVVRFLRAIPPATAQNPDIARIIEETAADFSEKFRSKRAPKEYDKRKRYFKSPEAPTRDADRSFGIKRSDFELCVCDPPTFSNSKSTDLDWDVQRRHVELLRLLSTRMVPGGIVYFSNNNQRFKLDEENLGDLYTIREISNRTIPEDFRNKRIHRCWRMIVKLNRLLDFFQ